jgi:hypothetical protein
MKKLILSVFALIALGFTSCNQEKTQELEERVGVLEKKVENLSAKDLINNPNTANMEQAVPSGPLPVIAFEKMEHDFGTIKQGEIVTYTFKFKNAGEGPLIIDNATASCGCTVPTWPKEPVKPNASGEITVQFDSNNKVGQQNKQVTISANTQPNVTQLTIKCNIIDPAQSMGPQKQ